MVEFLTFENAAALLTLTALEIVLGIDNIVFISLLTSRLPAHQQRRARRIGLLLAMGMRIVLLLALRWVMGLTQPWITVAGFALSGRDAILLGGGLFLVAKATYEIHERLEGPGRYAGEGGGHARLGWVLAQIVLLDVVFSLDSVITAVGMARALWVMVAAVMIAVAVMIAFAEVVSAFIERHPTMKVLALAFLILIGVMLVLEGLGRHVDKKTIYFAMAFSLAVELVNMRVRQARAPVHLRS